MLVGTNADGWRNGIWIPQNQLVQNLHLQPTLSHDIFAYHEPIEKLVSKKYNKKDNYNEIDFTGASWNSVTKLWW
jgi:hypothetical protein